MSSLTITPPKMWRKRPALHTQQELDEQVGAMTAPQGQELEGTSPVSMTAAPCTVMPTGGFGLDPDLIKSIKVF